jgi:serine/threonine protein kinase
MAEVYKVWDEERATYLALKLLREDLAQDRIFLRRFKREAQTLAELQHPNIVRFYGLEQDARLAFMLMDFVEGESLKAEIFDLDGEPMALERMVEIMRPVCSALHYAHNQGMVHCDAKPGNIMIEESGKVLVTDFGIARMTDAATATMVGMGTPAYMAPELVRGLDPTPQADIYALGVILFEMLTGGERPFTGDKATITGSTSEKVRWEQMQLQPPSPRRWNPDLSPELEEMVLKCLAKEPEKRYPSTLVLLNALQIVLGAVMEVPVAAPDIPSPSPPKPVIPELPEITPPERAPALEAGIKRPPKWAIVGGIVALVVLVGGLGGIMITRSQDAQATEAAIAQVPAWPETSAETATARPTKTPTVTMTQTPTSTQTPTVTSRSPITIENASNIDVVVTIGEEWPEEWISSVAFSPDSRTLFLGFGNGNIRTIDIPSLRAVQEFRGQSNSDIVESLAVSHDGSTLLSYITVGWLPTVIAYDISSGEELWSYAPILNEPYYLGGNLVIDTSSQNVLFSWIHTWYLSRVTEVAQILELVSGEYQRSIQVNLDTTGAVDYHPSGEFLAIGVELEGDWPYIFAARILRVSDLSPAGNMICGTGSAAYGNNNIAFSPSGRWLAVSCLSRIRIFDVQTWKEAEAINFDTEPDALDFSPDGSLLATSSGLIRVSDWTFIHKFAEGNQVLFSPDGSFLLSLVDGKVKLLGVVP